MNNKGFMMAEVIVASSIVLITLVGLFTSYNKIYVKFIERSNYDNIDNGYANVYLRNALISDDILSANSDKQCYSIDSIDNDKIKAIVDSYDVNSAVVIDLEKLSSVDDIPDIVSDCVNNGMSTTYKEYASYLSNNVLYDLNEEKYLIITERIIDGNYYYGSMIF